MYINNFPEKKKKKREDVLHFGEDTCNICHSKSDENLLCKTKSVFENNEGFMRKNILTLNRDKTEIKVFLKNSKSKFEQLHSNGIFVGTKTSCRHLGIMARIARVH